MTTQSNAIPGSTQESQVLAPTVIPATRILYWSVRRELWENRSVYLAPLGVAAIFLIGFLISLFRLPEKMRGASALTPMQLHELIERPYTYAALLIMGSGFVVALFYCLDALHGERHDRSVLFWKSLPVSDLTTVLSKATIPMVIIPLLSFAITVATQWLMLMFSTLVLLGNGQSVSLLWMHVPLFQMSLMLLYHLLAGHGLWYAPIYAWVLMVSAWARRATFLWAALPLVAIGFLEKVAFNTAHFGAFLGDRVGPGAEDMPYTVDSISMAPLALHTVLRFLSSPGLWIGLMFAAAFLAVAVRLRHNRGPV